MVDVTDIDGVVVTDCVGDNDGVTEGVILTDDVGLVEGSTVCEGVTDGVTES